MHFISLNYLVGLDVYLLFRVSLTAVSISTLDDWNFLRAFIANVCIYHIETNKLALTYLAFSLNI